MTTFTRRLVSTCALACFVVLRWDVVTRAALPSVTAVLETRPSFGDDAGGNADADDPAIWLDPKDPSRSLVVATLKEGGMDVYDLGPARAAHRARRGAAGHGLEQRALRPLGAVTSVSGAAPAPGKRAFAFVSRSAFTTVAKLELYATESGRVGYTVRQRFDLPETFHLPGGGTWNACHDDDGELSQVEGMVVDDYYGVVYLGQEQVGWWMTCRSINRPTICSSWTACANSACPTRASSTRRKRSTAASSTTRKTDGSER